MRSRWTRLLVVAALLCVTDAPLALIQGGAWAAMAWRAARRGSVASALSQTFDGRHPCAVCLAIRGAAPAPALRASSVPKLDLAHEPRLALRASLRALFVSSATLERSVRPFASPPVPPPEGLLS